ncbi:Oxysterol-binding protein 2 [Tetrabaena socialis]|uniref:Oxysterol-binding protein 2 n=1 Tax=Tetrabaena socialis TaxID=47790 RepID=A0A2J8A5D5_9CHLO|nr:Oxysterol-binding protein 2 [Tetrabaena socialis]|eukprot:PNH07720.1 Oxysterol-binding protein 2 [Tetrabaena socialis]
MIAAVFLRPPPGPQGYELYGEVETKTKFWGKAIDCILAGHMSIRLKAFGDEYRFNLGTLNINDIILGRFWIDLSCDMKVRNLTTGESSRLIIKPCRGYPYLKERGRCEGVVCNAEGKEVRGGGGKGVESIIIILRNEQPAAKRGRR